MLDENLADYAIRFTLLELELSSTIYRPWLNTVITVTSKIIESLSVIRSKVA